MNRLRGIIAIVRSRRQLALAAVIDAIRAGGVSLVEITLTTPGALDAVSAHRSSHPDLDIGVGSVRTEAQARAAIDAGATFLVTPTLRLPVLALATAARIPVACGAMTPTEVDTAFEHGADLVKIFPAATLGGARYVRELLAPMPDVPLAPTGGVTLDAVADYRAAGAVGLGVGSDLFSDARLDEGLPVITRRAAAFRDAWVSVRA